MFKQPLLPLGAASVFCGGILSEQRLNHPEGVLVDPKDGAIWCGGEAGELYRIEADGSSAREVAGTGGFALGLCMDSKRRIYICDLHHACVVVFDDHGKELKRLHGVDGDERLQLPNYAILSPDERYLYVSDTRANGGPGIWRFDLENDACELWMAQKSIFANGLAMKPDGSGIFMVESRLPGVTYIPILEDGSAGEKRIAIPLPHDEPDGLAFNSKGELYISIYNPSRIYRWQGDTGLLETVIQDDTTDFMHHCTNIAFRGDGELFCANLGAWHITRIDLKGLLP